MNTQNTTGRITESWVKDEIIKLGLTAFKPIPDRGVDLVITSKQKLNVELKVQIKGRGEIQKNNRYRWFQIRTTKKQREETVADGLPLSESWRKKVAKADIFIIVSQKFHEFWIFESSDIDYLVQVNFLKHRNRQDNIDGLQAEIDLDLCAEGIPLTELYRNNLNNWSIIANRFV